MWMRNTVSPLLAAAALYVNGDRDLINKSTLIDTRKQRIDNAINRCKEEYGIPGLSVAVSVNGHTKYAAGFGYANVESLLPCTQHTTMRIASISKPLTAAVVMRLVEQQRLCLDKDIHEYVNDYPPITWNNRPTLITSRQLLSHTSGIRHYTEKENASGPGEDKEGKTKPKPVNSELFNTKHYKNITESVQMFKHDPLVAEPGTKMTYTTHGFTLLGAVAESAANLPFSALLLDMFRQLGMSNTRLDLNKPIVADRANYYRRNKKHQLCNVVQVDCSYKWAGGGILSTVPDLLVFAHTMLSCAQNETAPLNGDNKTVPGPWLQPSTVQQMWTGQKATDKTSQTDNQQFGYGLGWSIGKGAVQDSFVWTVNERWSHAGYVSHTGGAVGCSSILLIRPDHKRATHENVDPTDVSKGPQGVCVAILANLQGVDLTRLALELVDIMHE